MQLVLIGVGGGTAVTGRQLQHNTFQGRERVFVEGLNNRHVFSGAVGWGGKDAAKMGVSYVEVEVDEGMYTAGVDIQPSNFRRIG